jgi:hypothetical protein
MQSMTATSTPTERAPHAWRGFIQPLAEGPLDIVGDVHGEIEALDELLARLGHAPGGRTDRVLVFVGDLTDRGPDSTAVVQRVQSLVQAGRAQCVAGNHEINLLRGSAKEGNGWFADLNHDHASGKFPHSRAAAADQREFIRGFFASLPLVLERPDLRVVHACWHQASVDALREADDAGVAEAHRRFAAGTQAQLESSGLLQAARAERGRLGPALLDPGAQVPLLSALAAADELRQLGNPVRVLSAGIERRVREPFFASGKWRMVERVPWWQDYTGNVPVVFGHYWRRHASAGTRARRTGGPDLFAGVRYTDWLGPRRNAFCIDYSVGRRFLERERAPHAEASSRLAALRWPECELVFEDGERVVLAPPGLLSSA